MASTGPGYDVHQSLGPNKWRLWTIFWLGPATDPEATRGQQLGNRRYARPRCRRVRAPRQLGVSGLALAAGKIHVTGPPQVRVPGLHLNPARLPESGGRQRARQRGYQVARNSSGLHGYRGGSSHVPSRQLPVFPEHAHRPQCGLHPRGLPPDRSGLMGSVLGRGGVPTHLGWHCGLGRISPSRSRGGADRDGPSPPGPALLLHDHPVGHISHSVWCGLRRFGRHPRPGDSSGLRGLEQFLARNSLRSRTLLQLLRLFERHRRGQLRACGSLRY